MLGSAKIIIAYDNLIHLYHSYILPLCIWSCAVVVTEYLDFPRYSSEMYIYVYTCILHIQTHKLHILWI